MFYVTFLKDDDKNGNNEKRRQRSHENGGAGKNNNHTEIHGISGETKKTMSNQGGGRLERPYRGVRLAEGGGAQAGCK